MSEKKPNYGKGFKWAVREHKYERDINIILFGVTLFSIVSIKCVLNREWILSLAIGVLVSSLSAICLLLHFVARFSHGREQKHFSRHKR